MHFDAKRGIQGEKWYTQTLVRTSADLAPCEIYKKILKNINSMWSKIDDYIYPG